MKPTRLPRRARGFTLIELLIVMVILGLLASLVGPRLFGQLDASKVKAARTQIEMAGAALDTYRLDMSRYPSTQEGLAALSEKPADAADAAKWRGPYLKKRVDKDPWGNSYVYKAPGEKADYELSSLGADGKEGGSGDAADIHSWE
ncbi:type II secretion system major pseudopilin GspG [Melaminivora jejuensis]|uniref:type II secretion system major pseudopilin GspG n=1 Tax=Melaminivora jejuensis TaxID=1267217 RepID=UPI001E511677|nr:type II secretion system major pseudopilin GspG [Melaminivora jejuensis]UHJ64535.1 type II secretion system major pseudopilin GspG [Melaminivora jejuensis]